MGLFETVFFSKEDCLETDTLLVCADLNKICNSIIYVSKVLHSDDILKLFYFNYYWNGLVVKFQKHKKNFITNPAWKLLIRQT